MTPEEIYNDSKLVLNEIRDRIGIDRIVIGLATGVAFLPIKKPKLYVWFFDSANDARSVSERLHTYYALPFDLTSTGQYLYVYEIMN
jgi:hypothetical protein